MSNNHPHFQESPSTTINHSQQQISDWIDYARSNYQVNPTEALAALMQAMTLNTGKASADRAMEHLRVELGDDIMNHVGSHSARMERAMAIVDDLLHDSTTFLYQSGQQDLLRQTMEDGSSVVCVKCNAVVGSTRWQQHQQFWCQAIQQDVESDEEERGEEVMNPE